MTRATRPAFSFLSLVALTISCADPGTSVADREVPVPKELPMEFEAIVSDPMSTSLMQIAAEPSLSAGVVYLSLRPQTIPSGRTLHVRNLGTGAERAASLLDGGLDPIAVSASVGDTLSLVATDSVGATKATTLIVTSRRPPRVVRTIPQRRKVDVPVNARITIVFSEPIAPAALTADAIRLQHGDTLVAGDLQLQPDQLTVAFTPSADLALSTEYQLFITQLIVDSQGEALDSAMTVEFRTIDPPAPPPGSLLISTVTAGTDRDPDGYFVGPNDYTLAPKRMGLNASLSISLPAGRYDIWLADVDANCSVGNDLVTVSVQPGELASIVFSVSCTSRSEQAADAQGGVFEAVRWEFFRDSAFADRYTDLVEDGVAGTLMLRSAGEGTYRWQWRTTYRWWGPDVPELKGGIATLESTTLMASWNRSLTAFECDLGDCGGPLHGPYAHVPSPEMGKYAAVRNGDQLTISGPTDCFFTEIEYGLYGCRPAWTRLTLRRVR